MLLNPTKYLEFGRDDIVSRLLAEIPARITKRLADDNEISNAIHSIEISDCHEPQLRAIMKCRDLMGAAAVSRLVSLKGASVKQELLESLVVARDDYNYSCNGIAAAIQPLITEDDLCRIVALVDSIEDKVPHADDEVAHGLIAGIAKLLSGMDVATVRDAFLPKVKRKRLPEVRARILCDFLRDQHSTSGLELAAELLIRGVTKAPVTIYFIGRFSEKSDSVL